MTDSVLSLSSRRRPGFFPVERQGDVDVGAQRLADGRPVLVASHERLTRVEMSGLVAVAVGHVRVVLDAGDREQVVAIGRFPDVDEIRQLFTVVPQIARADLETTRGAVVRVTGDAQRTLTANLAQDLVGPLVG